MKKFAYLLILTFSLVSFTSCEKDEDPTPDGITVNDLVGDWNFESLTFNGVVYDTEPELAELDLTYSFIQLSFLNVTTTEMGILDHRSDPSPYTKNYTLSNNTINFDGDRFVFHIENWQTFDNTTLKVKLIGATGTNEAPINGVYTMTR
jgi:hypothetical protein